MNQKRTIIGACEYSIITMQNLKKELQYIGDEHPEVKWAIGGIVVTLVSNLIKVADEVFRESAVSGEPNAKQDVTEIKARFSAFVDRMINHE